MRVEKCRCVYRKCRRVQMVSTLLKLLNISAVHIKSAECRQNDKSCFYGCRVRCKHAKVLKHQTQAPNASSNGGDASRVGKK